MNANPFAALLPAITADEIARYTKANAAALASLYDLSKPPERQKPRYSLQGKPICTAGNLTNIIAQAKAGKSAFIGAMIAARIAALNSNEEADVFQLSADRDAHGYLVHIDTEQSHADHYDLVTRALKRAGADDTPEWLLSFPMAGKSAGELRELLKAILYSNALSLAPGADKAHFGLFAVLIDGAADLVEDVNDAKECNPFVAELHALAITYRCPIISVIHENPATAKNATGKMRGHLGSQLERKAESNLRIKKEDEISVIFSDRQRGAPILEKDGPRFAYSVEAGMHVSVVSKRSQQDDAKEEEARDIADDVFAERTSMPYGDLLEAIQSTRKCSERTAERRFAEMRDHKIIQRFPPNLWAKAL